MSAAAPLALRPPFSFTFHATQRFMSRVWPTIGNGRPCADAREALSILVDAAGRAEMTARRTDRGHAVWTVAEPAMRWITKPGEFRGRRVAVVVTVLAGLEDAAAEEEAERQVMAAAQRLASAPEVGAAEPTSPPPGDLQGFALKAYRAWIALEAQRLAIESKRLKVLSVREAPAPPPRPAQTARRDPMAERTERIRLHHEGQRAVVEARERAVTERHHLSLARDKWLAAMADRLAAVDPVGSADLIEKVNAFRCVQRAREEKA